MTNALLTLEREVMAPGARPARRWRPSLSLQSAGSRVLLVAALCAVAYHYSFATMQRDWSYGGPLADLALVPVIAVVLARIAVERHAFAATVRLGRLDIVVATACLAIVAAALVLAPVTLENYYWTLRPDLLVLPLLVVAGVALLLGTRAVLALLFPLSFLLLAWPLPLLVVLGAAQSALTAATGHAVGAVLVVLPVGSVVQGSQDVRIHVGGAAGFDVSVASACSGIEGLVGLLVTAGAALYVIAGPVRRRLGWLLVALLAAWVANVVRIIAILAVGRVFGPGVALDVLHPVAGLILLNLVLLGMLLALPRFGLSLRPWRQRNVSDVPLTQAAPDARPPAAARLWRRAGFFAAAAVLLAVADSGLAASAGAFDNAGRPVAVSFTALQSAGPGVAVSEPTSNDWARAYFGSDSSWHRFMLRPTEPGGYTMWLDSIETDDVAALRAHPVASCYRFHHFSTPLRQRVPLTDGIVAQRFVYTRPDGAQWHTLTWEWPIAAGGGHVRHERVVLFGSSLRAARLDSDSGSRPTGVPIRDTLFKVLDRPAPNVDTNPALTASLVGRADTLIALHIRPPAPATALPGGTG